VTRRVVVTGAGVASSLGDSPAALHAALCEGRSGIAPVELFDTAGLGCPLGAEVKGFDPQRYLGRINLRPLDRTSRLVASAAGLALQDGSLTREECDEIEVGLVLGTMFCSVSTIAGFDRRALEAGPAYASPMDFANTVINAAAGQTAIVHRLRGVNSTVSTGATSGLQAVAYAADLIRRGRARAVLAGGVEEMCHETYLGFERAGLLCGSGGDGGHLHVPFDARRNGVVLGEGAALLLLEEADEARERGARVLAEVKGHASGYDPSRGRDEGQAASVWARVIGQALAAAGCAPGDVSCVSAAANGSVAGDRAEARGVAQAFGDHARGLPVTAVKSMLGETLGAAGALQAVALLGTMRDGVLPGILNLESLEEGFPLQAVGPGARQVEPGHCLVNAGGLSGGHCAVVFAGGDEL
jgi:3-oxoacyl-[acyl-carrier-protein] synthase II